MFLAGCRSNPPIERSVIPTKQSRQAQLDELGMSLFASGEYAEAVSLFERSLRIAYLHDNADMIAHLAYHLAASHARLRHYDTALRWVAEARLTAAGTSNPRSAELDLMEAKVLLRAEKLDQAGAIVDRALRRAPAPRNSIRARLLILRAQLAILDKKPAAASQSLRLAAQITGTTETAAYIMGRGRLAAMQKRWPEAARQFDKAADLYQQSLQFDAMVSALASAGRAYGQARKPALAANRLYRAGRSARMQENFPDAQVYLLDALAAAKSAKHGALIAQIQHWIDLEPNVDTTVSP